MLVIKIGFFCFFVLPAWLHTPLLQSLRCGVLLDYLFLRFIPDRRSPTRLSTSSHHFIDVFIDSFSTNTLSPTDRFCGSRSSSQYILFSSVWVLTSMSRPSIVGTPAMGFILASATTLVVVVLVVGASSSMFSLTIDSGSYGHCCQSPSFCGITPAIVRSMLLVVPSFCRSLLIDTLVVALTPAHHGHHCQSLCDQYV
jgi:hypothetical protein